MYGGRDHFDIVRVDEVEVRAQAMTRGRDIQSTQARHFLRPNHPVRDDVPFKEAHLDGGQGDAELLLAAAQLFARLGFRRDVPDDADDQSARHARGGDVHMNDAPVVMPIPLRHLV